MFAICVPKSGVCTMCLYSSKRGLYVCVCASVNTFCMRTYVKPMMCVCVLAYVSPVCACTPRFAVACAFGGSVAVRLNDTFDATTASTTTVVTTISRSSIEQANAPQARKHHAHNRHAAAHTPPNNRNRLCTRERVYRVRVYV